MLGVFDCHHYHFYFLTALTIGLYRDFNSRLRLCTWLRLVEMGRLGAYVRRTSLPISALCQHSLPYLHPPAFARSLQQISSPPNLSLRFFMNFVSRGDESRNGGGSGSLLRTENRGALQKEKFVLKQPYRWVVLGTSNLNELIRVCRYV